MKRRVSWFLLLLNLCIPTVMQAQSYDNLWKDVEQAKQKSLPQTVIKITNEIFRKAETEKNTAQMLKAYTARAAYRQQISPDSFYVDLQGLEKWAVATTKSEDCAVLHAVIAAIYGDYVSINNWQIRRRTDVVEKPSEDMREWSGNMFVQKILTHTHLALEDTNVLIKASTQNYIPFVEQGDASAYFYHDLYHMLAYQCVEALTFTTGLDNDSLVDSTVNTIYTNLINVYTERDNKDALLLVTLDKLKRERIYDLLNRITPKKGMLGLAADPYLAALNKLIAENKTRDICAEAYLAKAQYAQEKGEFPNAVQLCEEAIKNYPNYKRINALKELKQQIIAPDLSARVNPSVYPGKDFKLSIGHRNLTGFTVNLYKMNLSATTVRVDEPMNEATFRKNAKKISSQHYALVQPSDYQVKDTVFNITAPQEGLHAIEVVPDAKAGRVEANIISSSRLSVFSRKIPDNQLEIVVLDALSGQPVPEATVHLFANKKGEKAEIQVLTTNAEGKVVLPWKNDYRYIVAKKGTDTSMLPKPIHQGYYAFAEGQNSTVQVKLLTDRSLYRPGQTVYVKGIAFLQKPDTANVAERQKLTVTLSDANNREVGKQSVLTNEFGSFTTEFVLPSAGLNGTYVLSTENGNTTIRVEEYKRPTFDIVMDKMEGTYKLGDVVQVKGTVKTFSGVPVQELPVQYTVMRSARGWWGRFFYNRDQIASGSVQLNDKGEFFLPVSLDPEKNVPEDDRYYTYTISAGVTNIAGETQTSETVVTAGSRALLLSTQLPERINKDDSIRATFGATNLAGQPVSVEGTYKLYPFSNYKSRVAAKEPVYSGTFVSNKNTDLSAWQSLPSGAYKLVLSAKDAQGRETSFEAETVLFSMKDTRPAAETSLWYYAVNESFDSAHPAAFVFGTSMKDAYVMMDVFSGNKRLESRALQLSDSLMHFNYPYKESYGNGLSVTFFFMKEGEMHQQHVELRKRLPEKNLKLTWQVFRDKLRPGQKEEWKLTVQTPQGLPADAEMLATMYDASLDKIWKNNQSLKLHYYLPLPSTYWTNYDNGTTYFNFWFRQPELKYPGLVYDRFQLQSGSRMFMEQSLVSRASDAVMIRGTMGQTKQLKMSAAENAAAPMALYESVERNVVESGSVAADESLPEAPADLRANFAETAFFYPQLRTNEQGEIVLSFTMPESLTRWNFNGYAHTKGMLTGMLIGEAVTSKEFMLTPNLPRFVRVGDKTSVAASVANLTGDAVTGTVTLTLFDPLTEKVISTQKQRFTVEAGKTGAVSFMFSATDKYDLLGCRLVAEGGHFSDGEQHLLPVLSNKENVIETVAMPVRGNQTREFSLESLFNNNSKTATDRSLTVEFSGNPAWYAVQALPSLSMPTSDNAVSWVTSYYANSLASYIVNAQPRIKTIFDAWKQQGGTKETFLSNLQKNQDVKHILLEESPWLVEATTAAEQMERIALLFDLNTIQNNNITALTKLKDLQLATGAWAWYKGMLGSRYITGFVVETQARLSALTGKPLENDALQMQKSAFGFLHKEALGEYNQIREAEKAGSKQKGISGSALHYLYLIAISGEQIPESNKAAYTYFLGKVKESIASQSLKEKALSAVILQKAGRAADAQAFIASLKEHTTQTDEQGMFFDFNSDPYAWVNLKVPAHVAVMEAFDQVANDRTAVEEMKLWLLKQKQTQQWNSPVSTVNAVYALLHRGSDLLESQGNTRISLGGKALETLTPVDASIPGLSYIKEKVTDKATLEKAKKIIVERRDAGIAWGAVYAQYKEDIDKVTQQGEGLNVEKKLYVEKVEGTKKQLLPITPDTKLAVGDKVVSRLSIRLDRDMDFVQLKDQRGACFEPIENLSGYLWNSGNGYYVTVKDASTQFFFDSLKKGVYVLEYGYRVSRAGVYETGLAVIQSAYAPEYTSHSASMKVEIENK